jgi:hypothetical protein
MITPKVVIIMAQCSHSKQGFGIRLEEKLTGQWMADWAFPIKEAAAKREGYDKSEIAGSFSIDDVYPGCPHCEQKSIVKCICNKVSCGGDQDSFHTCPRCGNKAQISGYITSLSAGKDL